ncbi:unnamed protein product [Cyprideis torosa]|uniref:Uncharacterized protein n=1 Tax=Cyprideis torosa TaxID=163714 RepID=A0A7R8WCJ4_9CRUS|nr:unnamed protein product [Cyprideis torosa]CAG0893525.1 unnamed protein product [Cyprideis torosa]
MTVARNADEKFDGTYKTNVVVKHNGSCLYVPPGIFKSTCKIDITWFPFDDQHCTMKFGSWTYNGFKINMTEKNPEGGDTSGYIINGEWNLIGVPSKRTVEKYDCCPEPYIDITFTIHIRRRTLYYFTNLIVPCVLISSMTLLGFTLPPDSGEKLTLGVTILLSLTVFLNMVAETMPATSEAVPLIGVTILLSLTVFHNLVAEKLPQVSDSIPLLGVTILLTMTVFSLMVSEVLPEVSDGIPLIGTYFNCIMFMVASSVVLTVVILNYHHRSADTHEMPNWIKTVFLQWLPWILRMDRPHKKISFKTIRMSRNLAAIQKQSSKSLISNVKQDEEDWRPFIRRPGAGVGFADLVSTLPTHPSSCHATCLGSSSRELASILEELRLITNRMRKEEDDKLYKNDWKFAAMVVDRICLIFFTAFTVIATVVVLGMAPHWSLS